MFRIKVKIENRRDESEWFGVICFRNFAKTRLTLGGEFSVTTWYLSINFGKLVAIKLSTKHSYFLAQCICI